MVVYSFILHLLVTLEIKHTFVDLLIFNKTCYYFYDTGMLEYLMFIYSLPILCVILVMDVSQIF